MSCERLPQQHLNSKNGRPSDPLERLLFSLRIAAVTIAVVNVRACMQVSLLVAMTESLPTVPMLEK